jgi:PTS system nitrogen regulatory IIA component
MGRLLDHLDECDILLDVRARDKRQLFEAIGAHMERAHGIPPDSVTTALQRREAAGTTALGHGVAIPHALVKELARVRVLYARLSPPMPFDTPDGQPVSDVVCLMVPALATQEHLDMLAQVAALFSEEGFRAALHRRLDAAQIRETFAHWTR